jgi:hypothetical protein
MRSFLLKYTSFFVVIFFVAASQNACAQNDTPDPYVLSKETEKAAAKEAKAKNTKQKTDDFAKNLLYGGTFGAFFGPQTYIELSPKVGYKAKEKLVLGAGINYIYFSMRDFGQKFVTHIYGPSVFAQYALVSGLFAYGEFNAFSVATYNPLPPYAAERIWIGSAPFGLGYYSGGEMKGVYLSVLYDLINDPASPYYNGGMPILLRVGFLF